MLYETDPIVLAGFSDDQWSALLNDIARQPAPVPRPVVRLPAPTANPEGKRLRRKRVPPGRRAMILQLIVRGERTSEIAQRLGISASHVSRIVKGERN